MHQKFSGLKHLVPIIQLDSDPELTLPRCVTINVKLVVEILRQTTLNCRVVSESANMGSIYSIQSIIYENWVLETIHFRQFNCHCQLISALINWFLKRMRSWNWNVETLQSNRYQAYFWNYLRTHWKFLEGTSLVNFPWEALKQLLISYLGVHWELQRLNLLQMSLFLFFKISQLIW